MVNVPTTASETATEATEQVAVQETKAQKKARVKAEKEAAAALAAANPPAEGTPAADGTTPPVEPPKKGEHGMVRSKDVPWSRRKVAVLSSLKALGANALTSAKSAKEVVAAAHAAGYEDIVSRDVRHYVYHGAAGGLTAIADKLPEGTPGGGYGFYLTQLGVDQDYPAILASLVKPPKAEAAAPATTVPVAPATETPAS